MVGKLGGLLGPPWGRIWVNSTFGVCGSSGGTFGMVGGQKAFCWAMSYTTELNYVQCTQLAKYSSWQIMMFYCLPPSQNGLTRKEDRKLTIDTLLGCRVFCARVIHQRPDACHLPLFGRGQRADIWRKVWALWYAVMLYVYAVQQKCPHASSYATLLDHMRRWTRWRTFAVTLARHCGDTEADVSDHPKNYAILFDKIGTIHIACYQWFLWRGHGRTSSKRGRTKWASYNGSKILLGVGASPTDLKVLKDIMPSKKSLHNY